jgi:hypothetical protein
MYGGVKKMLPSGRGAGLYGGGTSLRYSAEKKILPSGRGKKYYLAAGERACTVAEPPCGRVPESLERQRSRVS